MTDHSGVVSRGRNVASRTGGKKIRRRELADKSSGRSRRGYSTRVHRHGRPLIDVLVDLAAARLDFVLGDDENTDTLRDELGGISGLTHF